MKKHCYPMPTDTAEITLPLERLSGGTGVRVPRVAEGCTREAMSDRELLEMVDDKLSDLLSRMK